MNRNLERMIRLADEVFAVKNDPEQISVNEEVMAHLHVLHPATLAEELNDDGPVAWALVVPTTGAIMKEFLEGMITERDLLDRTKPGMLFEALYLCSALVLPEFRKQGRAARLLTASVQSVCADHPVRTLFCWPFSAEGNRLAETVARSLSLPLERRLR